MSDSAACTFFDKVCDDHLITRLGDDADLLQIDRFRATDRERRPWAYI